MVKVALYRAVLVGRASCQRRSRLSCCCLPGLCMDMRNRVSGCDAHQCWREDRLWQACLSSPLTSREEQSFQFLRTALLLLRCCSYWYTVLKNTSSVKGIIRCVIVFVFLSWKGTLCCFLYPFNSWWTMKQSIGPMGSCVFQGIGVLWKSWILGPSVQQQCSVCVFPVKYSDKL